MLLGMRKSQQGAPELEAPQEARTGAGCVPLQQFCAEHRLMTRLLDPGRAEGMWRSQGEAEVGRRGGQSGMQPYLLLASSSLCCLHSSLVFR